MRVSYYYCSVHNCCPDYRLSLGAKNLIVQGFVRFTLRHKFGVRDFTPYGLSDDNVLKMKMQWQDALSYIACIADC